MQIETRKVFEKDAGKLSSSEKKRLYTIIEVLSKADNLSKVSSCKKLSGYSNAYRIRMGAFRIGLFCRNNKVELVRVLNRKDIYKYFPPKDI